MLSYFCSSQNPAQKIIIISILQVRKLPVVTLLINSTAECSLENNEVHYTPLWHMTCLNINKCFCTGSTSLWKSFVPKFHISLELPHIFLPRISLSSLPQLAFPVILHLVDAFCQILHFQRSNFLKKHYCSGNLKETQRIVKLIPLKLDFNFACPSMLDELMNGLSWKRCFYYMN